jgi:hypothetical protein
MNKLLLVIFVIFNCYAISYAQSNEDEVSIFSIEEVHEDLDYWEQKLIKKNPLLYYYSSKEEINQGFKDIRKELNHSMSAVEFLNIVSLMLHTIQDGHCSLHPSEEYIELITQNEKLLAIEVLVANNQLFLQKNLSSNVLLPPIGAEILSINGQPVEQIIQSTLNKLPNDGNSPFAIASLNENFRYYYHVFQGFNDSYTLSFLVDGRMEDYIIKGMNLKSIRTRSGYKEADCVAFWIADSAQTAYLAINTFDKTAIQKDCELKFKKEIDRIFTELKTFKPQNLVIDVRQNDGGNPTYVKYLLKQLMLSNFTVNEECYVVKKKHATVFEDRVKRKWYPGYALGSSKAKSNAYQGNVFVLISGYTFSAGVDLANTIQKHHRGILLGEESGGNPNIMGGYFLKTSWNLPNTGIQASISTLCTKGKLSQDNEGRGLIPDVQMTWNSNDSKEGQWDEILYNITQLTK